MTASQWYVPPFVTSIFFTLGVITLYWSAFTWLSGRLQVREKHLDLKKAQAAIGIVGTIIAVFGIQLLVRDSPLAWTFTNFQLLILIFLAYFLQVWIPYWGIFVCGVAFMIMNGNVDQPLSWLYTAIYGGFYAVSYLQSVRMWPHPVIRYTVTAIFFGLALWTPVIVRFQLSWATFSEELISYLVLTSMMYGFFTIQNRDQRIKDRLFQAANWDGLTHVKNYAAFDREIGYQFQRSALRHHDLSMIMFDIDEFKHINDTYGHLAGDQVLKEISKAVSDLLQRHDAHLTLFRTGGEEFNVVLPNTTLTAARGLAQEILETVAQTTVAYNGLTLHVTVSLGVSELTVTDRTPLEFYKRVDGNLYHSKRNGRQQITTDLA